MAWLRLDDGFTKHPKFEGWTPAQRWAWLEVMEYCARYRTRGRIPTDLSLLTRSTTQRLLEKAERSGWCVREDDESLWINDWKTFNPPRAEDVEDAVKTALEEHPDASANELYRIVGGNRNQVLTEINRYRTSTRNGTRSVPQTGIDPPVSNLVSRAPAHAFPSRPQELIPKAVALDAAREPSERTAPDQLDHIKPDLQEIPWP